ncbi:hypothetical protein GQ457_04G030780 [Hibiscus cannabinus]
MDKRHQKQAKTNNSCCSEGTHNFILVFWFAFNSCLFSGGLRSYFMTEVSSIEWEFINMSEQEEDLIYRMHKLVGDKWGLIAGRVPGRKAEEIERFWIMRHGEVFANKRRELEKRYNDDDDDDVDDNNNNFSS